jgi:PAS domain S-box-containing protein
MVLNPAATPVQTLLIEPDAARARGILQMFSRAAPGEFRPEHEATVEAGLVRIDEKPFGLIVLTVVDQSGARAAVRRVSMSAPESAIVTVTDGWEGAIAETCISEGAQDCLPRTGLTDASLIQTVRNALIRQRNLLGLREQMLEARAGEARFRNLIVRSADGLVILDSKGAVKFINRAAEHLFGRSAQDMVGKRLDIPLNPDGVHEIDIAQEAEAVANGSMIDLRSASHEPQTYRVRNVRFVVAEMRVFETEWAGEAVYVAALREVTSRKRAEHERLALAKISRAVNRDLDLAAVYERIGDELTRLLRYDRLEISLSRGAPDDARIVYVRGMEIEGLIPGVRWPAGGRAGFGSWMEAPLGALTSPAGYLSLGVRRSGAFTEHDSDLLERVAAQVYPAINNAQAYANSRRLSGAGAAGGGSA